MKKLNLIFFLLLLIPLSEVSAIRSRGVRGEPYETEGGYFGIKFRHPIEIPGYGGVVLETDYSSTINISSWKITDNKDLVIELTVLSNNDSLELYVEHMHADVFIEAEISQWDGILQDTMDDKYHSDLSYGFMITEDYSYSETFSIEGYSEFLTSYHSYYIGYYAFTDSSSYRLTEQNLRSRWDVYGSSFRIIYDICFRDKNWEPFKTPKFIVEDNIILNLETGWTDNQGDKADEPARSTPWFLVPILLALPVMYYWRKKRVNS